MYFQWQFCKFIANVQQNTFAVHLQSNESNKWPPIIQIDNAVHSFIHRLKNQFIECIPVYKMKRMQPLKQMAHNKHIIEYDLVNRDFGIALSIRRKLKTEPQIGNNKIN